MGRRVGIGLVAGVAAAVALGLVATSAAEAEPDPGAARFVCRSFSYDPRKAPELDTRDESSELGRWVIEREDRGWRVESVRPEVVVKATGTAEAWAHVCVVPVR